MSRTRSLARSAAIARISRWSAVCQATSVARSQGLAALVDHRGGLTAQREVEQQLRVLFDDRGRQPVDDGLELADVESLDRAG
jgi:hypothetical protein